MQHAAHRFATIALLFALVVGTLPAHGQEPASLSVQSSPVTRSLLETKLAEAEKSIDLDDATRTTLADAYRQALSHLETRQSHEDAAARFIQARETAANEARELREQLESAKEAVPTAALEITGDSSLADIEQLLLKEKADLAAAEVGRDDILEHLATETERPTQIRQRLLELKKAGERASTDLKLSPPAGQSPDLAQANKWQLETEAADIQSEIRRLGEELLSQPMRVDLLDAKNDAVNHSVEFVTARVAYLEEILAQRRLSEAEKARIDAEIAQQQARGKHSVIEDLATRNTELSVKIAELAKSLEEVSRQDESANAEATRLEQEFSSVRQKLEIAGLSEALGQILLEQKRKLPNQRSFHAEERELEKEIAKISLRHITHADERRKLRDISAYVTELTTDLGTAEALSAAEELEALAANRKELLEQAISTDEAHLRALGELDFAKRKLLDTVTAYDDYLAEHLLWVRTTQPFGAGLLASLPRQIAEFLSPAQWGDLLHTLARIAARSPVFIVAMLALVILKWRAPRIRTALQATGTFVGKPSKDRIGHTAQALGLSLLLALPWPLAIIVAGWQLGADLDATEFTRSVAFALLFIAPAFSFLRIFRVICKPVGVAAMHFRWRSTTVQRLRHDLDWLMATFVPATFVAAMIWGYSERSVDNVLALLAYEVAMVSVAVFFFRLFSRRGAVGSYFVRHSSSIFSQLQPLWLVLVVATPVVLGGLALFGYLYTAGTLTRQLLSETFFLFTLVLLHQYMVRWLLVTRHRLTLQAALARHDEKRAAGSGEDHEGSEPDILQVEESKIDFVSLSEESRSLINAVIGIIAVIGLWLIWSDVLPAFGFLDKVTLWHYSTQVGAEQKLVPITLADISLAVIIAILTIIAAKRLPSLLEILLLQRFTANPGTRYAVKTLVSYAIVAIGVVLLFGVLGGSWSQFQWIFAALGVGIGFGLQEIVANFISGLIILFERPIRVGDVVTVGDLDGVVTKIRIRATTIRNWDRKELLVPNKEFITGRLLNWSLSDEINRILIPVGIAYGSDVQLAMKLIDEAARENERTLEDPAPFVTFEGFGDNSLNLFLRCYIQTVEFRLTTITELHQAINDRFSAAGIEISFPQRDLHLDTREPLDIRLHSPGKT